MYGIHNGVVVEWLNLASWTGNDMNNYMAELTHSATIQCFIF